MITFTVTVEDLGNRVHVQLRTSAEGYSCTTKEADMVEHLVAAMQSVQLPSHSKPINQGYQLRKDNRPS